MFVSSFWAYSVVFRSFYSAVLHGLFCPEILHRWGSQVRRDCMKRPSRIQIPPLVTRPEGLQVWSTSLTVKCTVPTVIQLVRLGLESKLPQQPASTAVLGSYDQMTPLLIVRITGCFKEKLVYNMYPVYHADTVWFHHISRTWQCQGFVIPNKTQKWMDNPEGAFAHVCS